MKSAIFRRKFDENFPEFRRNCQEMTKCLEILRKSVRKIVKMREISTICEKFSFFISFFHSSPSEDRGQREDREHLRLGLVTRVRVQQALRGDPGRAGARLLGHWMLRTARLGQARAARWPRTRTAGGTVETGSRGVP